jgi:hypothetical protein
MCRNTAPTTRDFAHKQIKQFLLYIRAVAVAVWKNWSFNRDVYGFFLQLLHVGSSCCCCGFSFSHKCEEVVENYDLLV